MKYRAKCLKFNPRTIQFECQFRQLYMLKPQVGEEYVV